LIRRWDASDAAAYEGARLREGLLDKTNTASAVWADTAYRSKALVLEELNLREIASTYHGNESRLTGGRGEEGGEEIWAPACGLSGGFD
jgi:hypothetical protein